MDEQTKTVIETWMNGTPHPHPSSIRIETDELTVDLQHARFFRYGYSGRSEDRNFQDIVVQDIAVVNPCKGTGTAFVKALLELAKTHGRGVHIQQLITKAGIAWARKLLTSGEWYQHDDEKVGGDLNVFSRREE